MSWRPARACSSPTTGTRPIGTPSGIAVVIEEYLDGPEVSLFCLTDGATVVPLRRRAGLQTGRRRGHRTEHRRDGRLRAAALGAAGPGRRGGRARGPADYRRDGAARDAVRRPAVRRSRADLARDQGGGVQRPVRRSGDPGRAGAARDAARRPAAGDRDRHARRPPAAAVAGGCGGHRRASPPPATRRPPHRRPDRAASTGCAGGVDVLHAGTASTTTATARHQRRTGARR